MLCRKLLMHMAVDKDAPEGKSFVDYVAHLSDHGYVPPDGHDWVDQIRTKGNEANHEVRQMTREDAEDLLTFLAMLFKMAYEFPERARKASDD